MEWGLKFMRNYLFSKIYYLKEKIIFFNKDYDLVKSVVFALLISIFIFGFNEILESKVIKNKILYESITIDKLQFSNNEFYVKQEINLQEGNFNNILINTKAFKNIKEGKLVVQIYIDGNETPIDIETLDIGKISANEFEFLNFKTNTIEDNQKYYFTINISSNDKLLSNDENIKDRILYKVGYNKSYFKLSIFIIIISIICSFSFCYFSNKLITTKSKISAVLFLLLSLIVVGMNINLFYEENKLNFVYFISIISLIVSISYCLLYNNTFNKKSKKIYIGMLAFLIPFISLFLIQVFSGNTIFDISLPILVVNYVFIFAVYLFIYIVTNKIRSTVIIGSIIFYLIGLTYYYILLFRGLAVVPTDFYSIGTAISVTKGYKFEINLVILISIFLLFLIFTACKDLNYKFKISRREKSLTTLLITSVTVIIINGNNFCGTVNLWKQEDAYKYNGVVVNFLMNMKYLKIEKPENYSLEKVKNIASKLNLNPKEELQGKVNPNIIVIMNETFSDLGNVGHLNINEDYMPFIHNLKNDTIKGNLFVSSYGGYTANTEWEFLSGNSMGFISSMSVPYQQYIHEPTNSLATTLKSIGYSSTAIHPYYKEGWNRNKVYPLLGFEDFITIDDFKEPEILRGRYISDAEDFKKVIETYEKKKEDGKVFIFNTTIQNHGGYLTDNSIFEDKINLTDHYYEDVNEYLSLIKKSDEAFEDLLKYFSNEEKPTIIVMFGDHLPNLNNAFYEDIYGKSLNDLTLEEIQRRYTVPFIIWANYDIQEKYLDKISTNYLSTVLLETANLPLTKYNEFLKNTYMEIPVVNANGCIDVQGNYHTFEELRDNELINNYRNIQYNNMFDKNNIIGTN